MSADVSAYFFTVDSIRMKTLFVRSNKCYRYPEVLASLLEYHNFIINDLISAHWFLVRRASPLLHHIRNLDLSLSAPPYAYGAFYKMGKAAKDTRLSMVLDVLQQCDCLHVVRVSFDLWDREKWINISEDALLPQLRDLRVTREFIVELPYVSVNNGHANNAALLRKGTLQIQRRPKLRYWLTPGTPQMVQRVVRIQPVQMSKTTST